MAGNKRPSFLKRQKELQRVARATQKREERRLRKASPGSVADDFGDLSDLGIEPSGVGDETANAGPDDAEAGVTEESA